MQGTLVRVSGALQGLRGLQHAPQSQTLGSLFSSSRGMKESTSGPETPKEEVGSEKEVKYGVNTPRNVEEFAKETKDATIGLGESVKATVLSTANAIKRSLGMSSEKPLSEPAVHGAAGKIEHAPPGSTTGGPAASREPAEAKYQEMMDVEKKHFPKGEQSVNEMFPDQAEAAKLQNISGQKSDVKLDQNLHEKGP